MVFLNALQEPPEVALMLPGVLMLFALERSVLDICATVLAPVLWLGHRVSTLGQSESRIVVLTVDFQCSDICRRCGDAVYDTGKLTSRRGPYGLESDTERAEEVRASSGQDRIAGRVSER